MLRLSQLVALAAMSVIGSPFAATITVNSNADTVADDGLCTLREAIVAANTNAASGAGAGECVAGAAGLDAIHFALGAGTPSIGVTGYSLPPVTEPVVIDGATGGATRIELDGTAGTGRALQITAGGSTLRNLVINRFRSSAIELFIGGGNHVEGCYLGVDAAGTTAQGNGYAAIYASSPGNVIGGTTIAARNVISGNGATIGVYVSSAGSGTVIQGNYIGTDPTGTSAIPNRSGILIEGPNTLIGGTAPGARNLVSGNALGGITVGNTTAVGNVIQGNYIGTDASGTAALPNQVGIWVSSSASNTVIGGDAPGAGNLISGNTANALNIVFSITGTLVQGNFIGTDVSGNVALPNSGGVSISATSANNTIGGTTTGSRNVISGNTGTGVSIQSQSDNNVVRGNYIGVGADGTTPLGNGGWGVFVNSSTAIAIGGSVDGSGNRIWNNGNKGVFVYDLAEPFSRASILGNSIGANAGLGIDLHPADASPNDVGDGDTGPNGLQNFPVLSAADSSGGSTTVTGTLNSVASTEFRIELFASRSCDGSGNGEGETYLGFVTQSTDGSGDLSFGTSLPVALTWGQVVTATATNLGTNETSEFSACRTATAPAIAPVATTSAATAITPTGATLNGTVVANDASATATFEWGSSNAYGSASAAAESPLPGSATDAPVSASVTGLTCNTLYHFRVAATNSVSGAQGADQTFTTAACAPVVTTGAASAVTADGATLGGTVTAGGASTTVTFQYGLTTSYGGTANAAESPLPGSVTDAPVSASVTGLTCNTLYHFRVAATNSAGSVPGADQTFTTAACGPMAPEVTGNNPVGGGTITATVSGCGATCVFMEGTFIPVSGDPLSPPVPPPAGYTFPFGLFDFVVSGFTAGSTVTVTIVYPGELPLGTVYLKYGATSDDANPHWYPLPTTISGNTITLTITDGGIGDGDLQVNGSILDPGGPAMLSRPTDAAIPTLSQWGLLLLVGMMAALGIMVAHRRRFG